MPDRPLSPEQAGNLARSLFEGMNRRDYGFLEGIVTGDVTFDFPGTGPAEGQRRTLLLIRSIHRKFPELRFTVTEVVAQEDRACAVWTNTGRSVSGNPYSNSGITYFRFRDGKISFISDYFKDTSFAG